MNWKVAINVKGVLRWKRGIIDSEVEARPREIGVAKTLQKEINF